MATNTIHSRVVSIITWLRYTAHSTSITCNGITRQAHSTPHSSLHYYAFTQQHQERMLEQSRRSSPMLQNGDDHGGGGAKRVKTEHEEDEAQVAAGDEGEGAQPAAAAMDKPRIELDMEPSALQCPACRFPLKPPMFEFNCNEEHVVCFGCKGDGRRCPACDEDAAGATYHRCGRLLEAMVGAAKVPCPYAEHGCSAYAAHYEIADHRLACPCAPCSCPDPGCGFASPPAGLLDHLAAAPHSWPVTPLRYGRPAKLDVAVPPAQRWHVLVAQEDQCLFLLSLQPLAGAAATAVSLVCVRAGGAAAATPRMTCKLWADLPGDRDKTAMMTAKVGSSNMSAGGFAPELVGMWLTVPPGLVHMDDAGEVIHLSVRIDKCRSSRAIV